MGLDNYKEVFTDEHLRASLVNTVVFGTACVVGTMVLGFAVALLLNQRLRATVLRARRAAAVGGAGAGRELDLEVAVRRAATGSSTGRWSSLGFDSLPGLRVVRRVATSAYVAIFVTVVWQSFPFIALALLAGLQTMPRETLARRRGRRRRRLQRFRLVTLPLLRPIVAVLVIFSTIWDFKIFDQIYVMAAGVPGPRRGHRGGRRLPRGLRAGPLRRRGRRSPSCCS